MRHYESLVKKYFELEPKLEKKMISSKLLFVAKYYGVGKRNTNISGKK